jgi:hypothetical protein
MKDIVIFYVAPIALLVGLIPAIVHLFRGMYKKNLKKRENERIAEASSKIA